MDFVSHVISFMCSLYQHTKFEPNPSIQGNVMVIFPNPIWRPLPFRNCNRCKKNFTVLTHNDSNYAESRKDVLFWAARWPTTFRVSNSPPQKKTL